MLFLFPICLGGRADDHSRGMPSRVHGGSGGAQMGNGIWAILGAYVSWVDDFMSCWKRFVHVIDRNVLCLFVCFVHRNCFFVSTPYDFVYHKVMKNGMMRILFLVGWFLHHRHLLVRNFETLLILFYIKNIYIDLISHWKTLIF